MTGGPLRLLIVDDCDADVELAVRAMRKAGREVTFQRVDDAWTMRKALATGIWDVVLCDWTMPRFSAEASLLVLREYGLETPFIIVSGSIGEEIAVDAMRAGANDYVLKDRLSRLVPAIDRAMRERAERDARACSEAALRASEARFSRLANCGLIAILVANFDGKIEYVNDAFVDFFGYSREDLLSGRVPWRDKTPPEWQSSDDNALHQLREFGVAPPFEKEIFDNEGNRVPVLAGSATLDDPSFIRFFLDLSEKKRAELALHQSEEQLRQSQKMEAVGRLAGGVAHDFNNMLSVILSYADLILDDLPIESGIREDLEEMRDAATRAADLTRQLLMFSRQQVLAPRVLGLNEVIAGLHKMLRRMVSEDVQIAIIAGDDLDRVRIDASQFEQVLMNLVVNARDAMPTGGRISVRTSNITVDEHNPALGVTIAPGNYVLVSVTDTGTGMDTKTSARAFEPFFTTKAIGHGTGLGLSTVFGIMQQSGGGVAIDSVLGRGTTFRIYFPTVEAEIESPRIQSVFDTLRGTETILLVEDEESVRKVTHGILTRYGYRVIEVKSGAEALTRCREGESFDLLLTDVVMPHMSGPEVARKVRELRPHIHVLCMSGYTDDRVFLHGVVEGVFDYLQKPVTPHTLCEKVREVFDRNQHVDVTR